MVLIKNPLKVSKRLPVLYFRLQFRSVEILNERCNRNLQFKEYLKFESDNE
jgi:hypothetical protein